MNEDTKMILRMVISHGCLCLLLTYAPMKCLSAVRIDFVDTNMLSMLSMSVIYLVKLMRRLSDPVIYWRGMQSYNIILKSSLEKSNIYPQSFLIRNTL